MGVAGRENNSARSTDALSWADSAGTSSQPQQLQSGLHSTFQWKDRKGLSSTSWRNATRMSRASDRFKSAPASQRRAGLSVRLKQRPKCSR